jgi:hypothetical protein
LRRWGDWNHSHAYWYEHGCYDNSNQNAHCNEDTNCDENSDCNEHPDCNVYIYFRHDIE